MEKGKYVCEKGGPWPPTIQTFRQPLANVINTLTSPYRTRWISNNCVAKLFVSCDSCVVTTVATKVVNYCPLLMTIRRPLSMLIVIGLITHGSWSQTNGCRGNTWPIDYVTIAIASCGGSQFDSKIIKIETAFWRPPTRKCLCQSPSVIAYAG